MSEAFIESTSSALESQPPAVQMSSNSSAQGSTMVLYYANKPCYNRYYSEHFLGVCEALQKVPGMRDLTCIAKRFGSEVDLRQFYNALRLCDHENVLHVYSYTDNKCFKVLALEEFDTTLLSFVNNQKLNLFTPKTAGYSMHFNTRLICILQEIIMGLAHIHSKQLTHGPLKIHQILLNSSNKVKLAFGEVEHSCLNNVVFTSTVQDDLISLGILIGTILNSCVQINQNEENMVGEILDLIEKLSDSYYHNAIEVLRHPALWMIAEKKSFLLNIWASDLPIHGNLVATNFNDGNIPWKFKFKHVITSLPQEHAGYSDDYTEFVRFGRDMIYRLQEKDMRVVKNYFRGSQDNVLRRLLEFYPALLVELIEYAERSNSLHKLVKIPNYQ